MHSASSRRGRVFFLDIYLIRVRFDFVERRVDSVTNVKVGDMAERKFITPRRKRHNDHPSGSRPSERSDVSKEPARPPRTRTQQTANVTTAHNSNFGNGTQRSVFVESQQKPS